MTKEENKKMKVKEFNLEEFKLKHGLNPVATNKKYYMDAVEEIRKVIKAKEDHHFARVAVQSIGYTVSQEWIKGDKIGRVYEMPKKKEWRVQLSPAEPFGGFHKAWVVILPFEKYKRYE